MKIVAVVMMNGHEAYVLDRRPVYKYEYLDSNHLFARDGLFINVYKKEPMSKAFKAFAGREFDLKLKSGGIVNCYGQWWDSGQSYVAEQLNINIHRVTIKTLKELQDCYVFYSTFCVKEDLIKMREEYTGPIYEYWDYEKVIKYDVERRKWIRRNIKLDRAKRNIIKVVKEKHVEIERLKALYETR